MHAHFEHFAMNTLMCVCVCTCVRVHVAKWKGKTICGTLKRELCPMGCDATA